MTYSLEHLHIEQDNNATVLMLCGYGAKPVKPRLEVHQKPTAGRQTEACIELTIAMPTYLYGPCKSKTPHLMDLANLNIDFKLLRNSSCHLH